MACAHRAALAEKCPQTYAHNARGFPLLAMSAGPDTEESPGWLLLERSEGAYSFDIDGNRYIDWNCGFGPHILGFNNPIVLDAVKAELDDAGMHSVYWHTRHKQEKLAELLAEASPSVIEKVLFVNTGTEATMNAMKAGRAFTGKSKVGVFNGYYHGSHDYGQAGQEAKQAGVPQTTLDTMLTLPYNSDDALELIRENADDLALVMVEAVQGSCPQKDHGGWHEALAATCRECGVLLAFDETVCGFRLAFGGGHRYFGIEPDLVTYGKIIGHGMPIGAVCGRAEILSGYGASPDHTPELFGAVGTFNGNPLSMASGVACLSYLKEHQDTFYPTMRAELARMVATVNAHIEAHDLDCHMVSSDDRGHVFFQRTEVRSAADVSERQTECARELGLQLNLRGVFVGGGFLYSAQPSPSPTRWLGRFCWLARPASSYPAASAQVGVA